MARKRDLSQIVNETTPDQPGDPVHIAADSTHTTLPTAQTIHREQPPAIRRGKGRREGDRRMTLDLPDTVHADLHRYAVDVGLKLGRSIRPQHITRALVYTLLADTDLSRTLAQQIDEDLRHGTGR
ncbi:hypothetical protein [Pseudonocardia sp. ICBG1293]|uniref:hypothetical protein n=1 Tax=Pseudonocardia sp. ICBG1293 TaxID=2844382 RepID=UPI001CCE76E9|nr:hypothetical protein [Pseudonocardia sp. ICBG1293]